MNSGTVMKILKQLKFNLQTDQKRMTTYSKKKSKDVQFEVEELVLLKLRPHRKNFLLRRMNQKLAVRYYGPFIIKRKLSPVVYELELPSSSQIAPELPAELEESSAEYIPHDVVEIKQLTGASQACHQVLISWEGKGAEESTWMTCLDFKRKFPDSNLSERVPLLVKRIGPNPRAATELIRIGGVLDAIVRHLKKADENLATEVAWVAVYLSALSNIATSMMVKNNVVELLVERLTTANNLQLLLPVLRSLGNLVAGDSHTTSVILVAENEFTDKAVAALVKCLKAEHRVLKKEASWVLSNIAAGSFEHKRLIYSSEATPLLLSILSSAPFDIRKEAAYVLGNLCVAPSEGSQRPSLITEHLVSLVGRGCLLGYINLVRSADMEAAKLGLQFLELVLRGMPNGEGVKLVEKEDGIEAMERFQFHENEELRIMANGLVDAYFGEDYGLDD
ncbi:hypothetical protein V2J09_004466 [Rumex salicifolius]